MAERKAQNKYYPPNFDWKIHGSINKMKGQHPLRQRAKKIGEGILTIRFELPFNCWCTGCEKHIGIGVRYNAQKQKIGMYFTTPIWSFKMKCHLCPNRIQINTDPQSGTYKIIEGLRLREESYDPKSIGVIELQDEEETKKLENDPFYKLEHGVVDEIKATTAAPKLHEIQSFNDQYWKDPYTLSQLVRKKFRSEKKAQKEIEKESESIQERLDLSIPILPEDASDAAQAAMIDWDEKKTDSNESSKLLVHNRSIFRSKVSKKAMDPKSSRNILLNSLSKERNGDPFGIQSNSFAVKQPNIILKTPNNLQSRNDKKQVDQTIATKGSKVANALAMYASSDSD